MLRTGNTVSTDSVTAPWSLGSRSERTWKVRERQMNPNSDLGGAVERRERGCSGTRMRANLRGGAPE